jgi:DNA-binding CsgD family transcriptional regulator
MLFGRAEEQRRIEALLEAARSGQSAVLGLVGEPGIGKSALLSYAAERADGFQVLRARAVEAESHIPFSSLLELLRPVLVKLTRIPDSQAVSLESALALRPALPSDRFAVGAATLSLLAVAAEDAPVAVLIDDAHWLDPSSAEALRFALRRLVADPVAVLVAAREGEPSVLDDGRMPTATLGGLAPQDASALFEGSVRPELVEKACRATGGNPLALLELVKGFDPLGLDVGGGGIVPVPTAISREFLRRARGLHADALFLVILAAAHDDGDVAVVERAATHLGLEFATITAAETTGLLSLREGRIEFRHPLARSAVYGAAPAEARRDAHRALAAVLSDRDVDRRAWHLASAAVGTDAAASAALRQAAERARERSAYAVAAAAFDRAARLAPDEDERAELLWAAAQSSWQAGAAGPAREYLAQARGYGPVPGRVVEIARLEGEIALHVGPVMDGYTVLVEAAANVAGDAAVRLLAEAAIACLYAGRPAQMLEAAERAQARIGPESTPRARFFASMARGMALILGSDGERGAREIRTAGEVAVAEGLPDDPGLAVWLVMGPMWLRDGTAARAVVDRALESARSRSAIGALPFLLNHLARDQAGGQEWSSAGACYDESIRLSRETGQRTELAVALAGLAVLEARQGREATCRAHAADAVGLCRELGMGYFETWAVGALGELELALGGAAAAARHFERQSDLLGTLGVTDPDALPGPELVEAYVRLGRRDAAERAASDFEALAEGKGQAWSLARARRCRGLVRGDFEAPFEEALALHRSTPDVFELAKTSLAYGARLRRARKRARARTHLRSALETFDQLGAGPWTGIAQSELGATGETIRTRESGAFFRLTPQELQIAVALSEGMSTREAAAALFVSPKTVEYHLRHVYQKLGVRSRDDLARALASTARPASGEASGAGGPAPRRVGLPREP